MKQQPKVSVLISFYNLAPYVDQTMQSVLAQKTDFPVEVLCADDGSDDGTIEILRAWEQKYPDTVRVFVMDRTPGANYEANERIRRMNAIRGRLFYEAKGEYVCYLDGDDFYTDDRKLQKQAEILDADTAHRYVACGHNGCYYWQSTGKTQPIEKPLRACSLTAKEYWSFLYVHTNAMMFRNVGLQGIDPYASGVQIIDNMLTFQFLPYGGVYYLPDCMFHYRQIEGSTYHRRSVYQNYILNALMLYQQKVICKGFFASGLVRTLFEYSQLFAARKDPQLTAQAQTYLENIRTYHAGRLRRIVNYNNENVLARLWCEVENPVWFFITKVYRHFIWKPKVRALLEEARQKQEQTA
ncbi:MAG TPA: glycosyltransferase [Candidatus Gemmiger excrementipullorum]|uniref:Glycosyltransferase n=1 Tax=Candidatus Gemmiger excrementipullorum TaxID=2838610 RepID=A0A9D1Y136_9FIRM|nr:glycosyltransferase [Candidatus Gemmiger excrementipullorum]